MFKRAQPDRDYPTFVNNGPISASSEFKFDIPRPRVERFKACPLYQGAIKWNRHNAHTQKTDNYLAFKNIIKSASWAHRQAPSPN